MYKNGDAAHRKHDKTIFNLQYWLILRDVTNVYFWHKADIKLNYMNQITTMTVNDAKQSFGSGPIDSQLIVLMKMLAII